MTLDDLRRSAVSRTLFPPTTLQRALDALGFVQADPIRAPARAQDLTLRHRVAGYRAGDLERLYAGLDVHEDFFVNYGFVTGAVLALMPPRRGRAPWSAARGRHVPALLDFVRTRGPVHPREVAGHFAHGSVTNYWGGSSNESYRVSRRAYSLRGYAHGTTESVFPGGPRAGRPAISRACGGASVPLGRDGVHRQQAGLHHGDPAELGAAGGA